MLDNSEEQITTVFSHNTWDRFQGQRQDDNSNHEMGLLGTCHSNKSIVYLHLGNTKDDLLNSPIPFPIPKWFKKIKI